MLSFSRMETIAAKWELIPRDNYTEEKESINLKKDHGDPFTISPFCTNLYKFCSIQQNYEF